MALTQQEMKQMSDGMGTAMEKVMKSHQLFLKTLAAPGSATGNRRADSSPTEANDSLTSSITALNKHMEKSIRIYKLLNTAGIGKYKQSKKQDKIEKDLHKRKIELLQDEKKLQKELDKTGKATKGMGKKVKDTEEDLKSFSDTVKDSMGKWLSTFSAWKGLAQGLDELQTAASRSGVYNFQTQLDSIVMGMSAKDLIESQAKYRTDILRNSRGLVGWTETLKASQMDLLPYTGSLVEANKAAMEMRSVLMSVGISFNEVTDIMGSGEEGLIGTMKRLSIITGKTVREMIQINAGLIQSDDARLLLTKMTKQQRIEYMNNSMNTLEQYTKLTGSVERAQAIIREQQADSRKTFKDRFVEAAKLQAAATRAGMSPGDAKRIGELRRINPAQLSALEREEQKDLFGELSGRIKEMEGSGNFYLENIGNVISRLAGDGINVMNPALDNPLDPSAIEEQAKSAVSATIAGTEILAQILAKIGQTNSFLKGAMAAVGFGAAFGAGKFVAGRAAYTASQAPPHLMPGGAPQTLASKAMGNLTSTKGKLGLGLGAVAGAAGMAINHFYIPETSAQERGKKVVVNALEFAGTGAMIGTIFGPVGTAVGAGIGAVVGGMIGLLDDVRSDGQWAAQAQIKSHNSDLEFFDHRIRQEREAFEKQMSDLNEHDKALKDIGAGNLQAQLKQTAFVRKNAQIEHKEKMSQLASQRKELENLSNTFDEIEQIETDQANLARAKEGFTEAGAAVGRYGMASVASYDFGALEGNDDFKINFVDTMRRLSKDGTQRLNTDNYGTIMEAVANKTTVKDPKILKLLREYFADRSPRLAINKAKKQASIIGQETTTDVILNPDNTLTPDAKNVVPPTSIPPIYGPVLRNPVDKNASAKQTAEAKAAEAKLAAEANTTSRDLSTVAIMKQQLEEAQIRTKLMKTLTDQGANSAIEAQNASTNASINRQREIFVHGAGGG